MKFSAWNVDFSSPSPDPLDSRRPSCQRVVPLLKVVINFLLACLACKWLQIGTAMLLIMTSTDDELLRNVNIDDLEWLWTLKILIISDFLAIFGCKRVNCNRMDGDRPRLPANRNCHRLSCVSWALAQISCFTILISSCLVGAHINKSIYRKTSKRSSQLLSIQFALTPACIHNPSCNRDPVNNYRYYIVSKTYFPGLYLGLACNLDAGLVWSFTIKS